MTSPTSQPSHFDFIITCADGLELPLQTELASLGMVSDIKSTGRLAVHGTLTDLYNICLWSRVASRVLLLIKRRNINKEYDVAEQLYGLAKSVDWSEQFGLKQTFAIRVSVDKRVSVSQQFAMLRIKDAIADVFNDKFGERPNVDSKQPDFTVFATVNDKQAELYLDLSGTSLHRRGYRVAMTDAPLKENLAAALLISSGWLDNKLPCLADEDSATTCRATDELKYDALIDPMCGSGTFLIEALLMCCDYPVGIDKAESQFGFYGWQHHDSGLWQSMVDDARGRFHYALDTIVHYAKPAGQTEPADTTVCLPTIIGYDSDVGAIRAVHKNMIAAGLQALIPLITLEQRPLSSLKAGLGKFIEADQLARPLIITNPPYGERLGSEDFIKPLYQGLGLILQDIFSSDETSKGQSSQKSQATKANKTPAHQVMLGVLAAQVEHADILPISDPQTLRCHNGAITVYFRHGSLIPNRHETLIQGFEKTEISVEGAQDFVNRLQKNLAHLKKLAARDPAVGGVTNLRVYDADLPDFKVAIDVYGDYVHVQEFAPPKNIPPETAKRRFNLALLGTREVLGINREQVFIKTRARQSGNEQYSKQTQSDKRGKFYIVRENGAYFYVNFTDYLDTGLFVDHRNMRGLIKAASRGADVLNLFAYTCTASVHAALAGAKSVTSVDLSQNYLDWGKQNFALNGLDMSGSKYRFVSEDIFEWIKDNTEQFDTIFIDPPTFSNSKKFQGTFDVQRDHTALINRAMNRLRTDGVLYFSNNFSKFELDETLTQRYEIRDITHETIGFDFNIKKPIHHSFEIRHQRS
ncbi:MAG: bifunctional 23S rRNA (guanine(2069)-N(7))-methyltransferase RlmK/23S rRNA (guanine(2445)-N(2))-methyltransferase RlmL [Psychrobacter sp.]|nr:bifunctional 23S rRNA (guanine(2069)-N(7))-methyltransferase RlmK/23S rRNA (guanine(2445)-N(2))-methyltransferase RlmL [Psychrobacter sp.]